MKNNSIKYKNTNNDFVPQIPENWEFLKMRHIGNLYSGLAGKSGKDFQIETSKYRYVPFTSISNDIRVNLDKLAFVKMSEGEVQNQVNRDDILFLMSSETQEDIGKCAIVQEQIDNLFLNSFCKGFRISNKEVNANFLIYALNSLNYRNHFMIEGKGFTRINLKQFSIKNLAIALPPYEQQIAIANFLDKKCEQINQFIADKKQLINLLKEQRQSVIDAHFSKLSQLVKLKYLLTKMGSGVTPKGGANVYKQSGIYFLRSQNIHNDGLRLENVAFITKDVHRNMASSQVKKNDVLINITGASIGRCFTYQLDDEANINQHICIMRPDLDMINPQFLMYQIQSTRIQNLIDMVEGASREGLTNVVLKNYPIAMTSLEEQLQIINKIKEETKTIDETIFKTEEELRLVAEYKEALISNAVTGQLHIA